MSWWGFRFNDVVVLFSDSGKKNPLLYYDIANITYRYCSCRLLLALKPEKKLLKRGVL